MPKKKLTKAQVKNKMKTINKSMDTLLLDRLLYRTESHIPISFIKLKDIADKFALAIKRIK
jgi:hypothetical protein